MSVAVRFAPSPTGPLHIGSVRTALFNFLFARHAGGRLYLRIEDTDRERSTKAFEEQILADLKWLGLTWDGEVRRQSETLKTYQHYAGELVKQGKAYKVDTETQAVKFTMPKRTVTFRDLVLGDITVDTSEFDDLVILKSDGFPTYNFACVVDDHAMGLTHVIRGQDHITNTPKQILLYEALSAEPPQFAHIPLIVDANRVPLSKRTGEANLQYYQERGYLPEGFLNYLALLGWGAGGNQEFFTLQELIATFDLARVNRAATAFSLEKLNWINTQHIRALPPEPFLHLAYEFINQSGIAPDYTLQDTDIQRLKAVIPLFQERVHSLADFKDQVAYFFLEPPPYDQAAVEKYLQNEANRSNLKLLAERFRALEHFDSAAIETALRSLAKELGLKAKDLIHPTRVAVSGRAVSAGLFQILAALGQAVVVKRLERVANQFEEVVRG